MVVLTNRPVFGVLFFPGRIPTIGHETTPHGSTTPHETTDQPAPPTDDLSRSRSPRFVAWPHWISKNSSPPGSAGAVRAWFYVGERVAAKMLCGHHHVKGGDHFL